MNKNTKTNNSISYKVALEIRKIRKIKNITQRQLGTSLNITAQQIACYEIGETQLTLERFIEICNILEINAIKLLQTVELQPTFVSEKNDIISSEKVLEALKTILQK